MQGIRNKALIATLSSLTLLMAVAAAPAVLTDLQEIRTLNLLAEEKGDPLIIFENAKANARVAGISNAGIVGGRQTPDGGNNDRALRWMPPNYEVDNLGKGLASSFDKDGNQEAGIGFQPRGVSPGGNMGGRGGSGWDYVQVDLNTGEHFNLAGGEGWTANDAGIQGGEGNGQVSDRNGVLQILSFLPDAVQGRHYQVNNNNRIIGRLFGVPSEVPHMWLPTGVNTWGDAQAMQVPDGFASAGVRHLGNNDFSAGNGNLADDGGSEGLIWDPSGNVVRMLGVGNVVDAFSHDGTAAAGRLSDGTVAVWASSDGWQTAEQHLPDDLLASVAGGGEWDSLTRINGINDRMELTGSGLKGGVDTFFALVVPEPATLGLLAFGGLIALRRNRR